MPSVFGELRHPGELEEAVLEGLRKWMPTYVKRVGETSKAEVVKPKSYTVVSEYSRWPETQLPAIVVESGGLLEPPEEDGEGFLSGHFGVEVAVVVQGPNGLKTREAAMKYTLAIIGSLLQHRKLDEGIWVRELLDMGFSGDDVEKHRTKIVALVAFSVTLRNFINVGEGPMVPIPDETDEEWPLADPVEIEVEKVEHI